MSWTSAADLRAQVQKLWDKGDLLRPCVHGEAMLPRRLRLVGPTSTELTERFDAVRVWMKDLGCNAPPHSAPRYRIVLREFRHRVLGTNAVPDEIWLDTLDDALALADAWQRLLNVISWLQSHPRPGIYLRQVDITGVDSKFIEAYRGVLSELLDLALPLDAIDASATGAGQFCRRYGFKDKPLRIRFRLLDASRPLLPDACEQDIGVTQVAFEHLDLPVQRVFITENEVNFLAFPPLAGSMVIFGAGYGFEVLAGARWLHERCIYYWGDIDTHGFAILDQLRAQFSHVQSLLMDHATLMAHQTQWGLEPQPLLRDLPRLTPDETALFNDLRDNKWRVGVRLEQERIGFGWVQRALADLKA